MKEINLKYNLCQIMFKGKQLNNQRLEIGDRKRLIIFLIKRQKLNN